VVHEIQNYYRTDKNLQWIVKKALNGAYATFVPLDKDKIVNDCPLLSRWFELNNIHPAFMCFFVSPPFKDLEYVHTDVDEAGISINFPVTGCLGTSCIFYHVPDDMTTNFVDLGNKHVYINCETKGKWHEHTRYELVKPIIMTNQIPHRFTNPNKTVRISFSVRLDPSKPLPTHLIKEN